MAARSTPQITANKKLRLKKTPILRLCACLFPAPTASASMRPPCCFQSTHCASNLRTSVNHRARGAPMTASTHYQAIVIGSGQGGTPLCRVLAEAGLRTALIERSHIGGTCVNEGCTPTKTMVASGRVAYLARRGKDYGVPTRVLPIDIHRVLPRQPHN